MSEALRELQLIQFAIEGTAGTAVAADEILLGDAMDFQPEIERVTTQDPRGVLANVETADVRKGTRFAYAGNLDYEQVLLPLLCGLDGSVTPVDQGTGGPYLWDFDPGLTAAQSLKSATFEFVEDDGSTEHVEREAAYMTCESFTLEVAIGQLARLSAAFFGRADQTSTVTGALSVLSRTLIPSDLFKVYVDDSGAGLGGTEFAGHIRAATLQVNTGVTPKYSLKGRTDLDMTGLNRNKITGTLTLRAELDATAGDSGEFGDWRAAGGTKRFVRLIATDGTKILQVDVCIRYLQPPRIVDEDGVKVLELVGEIFYDTTWAKAIQVQVTNSLSSFSTVTA